jgi:hypothetical protein
VGHPNSKRLLELIGPRPQVFNRLSRALTPMIQVVHAVTTDSMTGINNPQREVGG